MLHVVVEYSALFLLVGLAIYSVGYNHGFYHGKKRALPREMTAGDLLAAKRERNSLGG